MRSRLGKLFWVALAALAFRACAVETARVVDDSALPLLAEGDTVLVMKLRYGLRVPGSGALLVDWSPPQKGDLVMLVDVGDPPGALLRRVSAVPGEQVTLPTGKTAILGPEQYYVTAENPGNFVDSRTLGPISRRSITGKVTHTWFAKSPSTGEGSKVESEKSRILQPLL